MDYLKNFELQEDGEQYWLAEAQKEDAIIIAESKRGMQLRDSFLNDNGDKPVYFENNFEKMQKIQEWYPRAYKILQEHLPQFVEMPDDMSKSMTNLANCFIQHLFLSEDRDLLKFA